MVLVINDAGHGGIDGGASAKGLVEKTLTLEASNYINKRLNELGVKSTVTRSTDVPLKKGNDNSERTNKIKNSGAKVCLCHHYNAGGGNGAEMIVSKYSNQKLAKMIINEMQAIGHPIRPKSVFTRLLANGNDYYYIHRDTGTVETIIIEYDFLDNKNNDKIKDVNYRIKLYEAVIKAVSIYFNIQYTLAFNDKTANNSSNSINVNTNNKIYRVIAGSFKDKSNADNAVNKLKKLGIESFIEVK